MKVAIFTPRLKSKGTERIYDAFVNLGIDTYKVKLSSVIVDLTYSHNSLNDFMP